MTVRFRLAGGSYRSVSARVNNDLFVAKAPPHSSFPVALSGWSARGRLIKTIDPG